MRYRALCWDVREGWDIEEFPTLEEAIEHGSRLWEAGAERVRVEDDDGNTVWLPKARARGWSQFWGTIKRELQEKKG